MSEPDGGDVTVSILPGDADLTVSHSLLTFAPADWNEARTVTVTAAGVPPGVRITPLPPPPPDGPLEVTFTPSLEVLGARWDGGDGETGAGVELGGGLEWMSDGLSVEARGRTLAVGDAVVLRRHGGRRDRPRLRAH